MRNLKDYINEGLFGGSKHKAPSYVDKLKKYQKVFYGGSGIRAFENYEAKIECFDNDGNVEVCGKIGNLEYVNWFRSTNNNFTAYVYKNTTTYVDLYRDNQNKPQFIIISDDENDFYDVFGICNRLLQNGDLKSIASNSDFQAVDKVRY